MEKILLDSHVFLDYFLKSEKEKMAGEIITKIINGKLSGFVSTIAIAEVKYKMLKLLGHERAENSIFLIKNSPNLKIIDIDHNIAEMAADIRYKYYKKNERELSYADAIHISTALITGCDLIITGDSDFKNIQEIKTEIY